VFELFVNVFVLRKENKRQNKNFNNWSCKIFRRNIQFIVFYDLSNANVTSQK
jgi:hypothetical protein